MENNALIISNDNIDKFISEALIIPKSREEVIAHYVSKILKIPVNILPISSIAKYFKKANVPLYSNLMRELPNLDKFCFIALPKKFEGNMTKRFFSYLKGENYVDDGSGYRNLNIAGFYSPDEKIIVITALLQYYNTGNEVKLSDLSPVTYSYIFRILVHELTHYAFNRKKSCFNTYVKKPVMDFYRELIKPFDKDVELRNKVLNGYEMLIDNEDDYSRRSYAVYHFKELLKQHQAESILAQEMLKTIKLILRKGEDSTTPHKLRMLTTAQSHFKETYSKFGVTGIFIRNTVFGQEVIIPSEVACLLTDHFIVNNTLSLNLAKKLLNCL